MAARSVPRSGLSPKFIAALTPAATPYEVGDRGPFKGLRLRLTPKGSKAFRWYYQGRDGKRGAVTIGTWSEQEQPGHVTLAQAREWLVRLREAHRGGNLAAAEADLRTFIGRPTPGMLLAAQVAAPMTVEGLCERFYRDRIAPFRQRPEHARYILDHDIIPAIGALPISALNKAAVTAPVKAAVDRGSKGHAVTVLQIAKMLTRYAYNHDLIAVDYGASLDRKYLGAEAHTRGRFLGDDELPAYLATMEPRRRLDRLALSRTSEAVLFGFAILLRTGERPIGLLRAEWSDLDLKRAIWTQPPERQAKKRREEREQAAPWEVPLARQTVKLFRKLRALTGKGKAVLPLSDHQVLARALARLQEAKPGEDPRLNLPGGAIVPYDLRRSIRAGMERLGVDYAVAEKVLNHRVPGVVASVYARDPLLDRRREAVQAWADHLDRLARPLPANVVKLRNAPAAASAMAVAP